MIYFVIQCGATKLDHAAPARELYTSGAFRKFLRAAEAEAAFTTREGLGETKVLIMSARYGLVELDAVLEPYNLTIDDPGAVTVAELTAQFASLGIEYGDEVYAMLPKRYYAKLAQAAVWATSSSSTVRNVYAGVVDHRARGGFPHIGYQHGVAANLLRQRPPHPLVQRAEPPGLPGRGAVIL